MPRQANTKDLILQATIELLATKGLVATSTRAIARKVDISENTIYRHYQDKDELIQKVFLYCLDSMTHFLKKNEKTENATDALNNFITAVCHWAYQQPWPMRILLNLNSSRLDSLQGIEDPFDLLEHIIKRGQNENLFRQADSRWLSTLCTGMILRPLQMLDHGLIDLDEDSLPHNLSQEILTFLTA